MFDFPVLIVDEMHPSITELLDFNGFSYNYFPDATREDVLALIPPYKALIIRSKMNLDKEFFEKATHLKVIARAGAGIDQIDEEIAHAKGIKILNAPEANRDAVGEHALGMLLSLMNNLRKSDLEVRSKIWDREGNRGYEITGKTVAIIGYGNMGKSFAKKLAGFDVKVLAYDKFKTNYADEYASESSLEEIFEKADILSLHIPLNEENEYFIDGKFLNSFRKNIYVINTARGKVLALDSLVKCLRSGKVIAAGLDVLENEKLYTLTPDQQLIFNELAKMPNVLFSPHVAGWTFESYYKINVVLIEKLKTFYQNLNTDNTKPKN